MPQEKIVLCFCKYPDPGIVKLRLASSVGKELAAIIYKALLEHTVQTVCSGNHGCAMYCYPDSKHIFFRYCNGKYHIPLYEQEGCGLGSRMFNAISTHLSSFRHVVLVGSDCPELSSAYIDMAFRLLETGNDIVLGPARDGGYILIGAKKICRSVFDKVSWGTDQVLQQTQEKIQDLHWKSVCTPHLRDVDTFSDYRHFLKQKQYMDVFSLSTNSSRLPKTNGK